MKKLMLVVLMVMFASSSAFAWGGHGGYRYGGGRYYHDSGMWFGIGATALVVGTLIHELNRPEVVVVNQNPYYVESGVYYTRVPNGYVVVEQPRVPVTVNIPNRNGSYMVITLTPKDNGWTGPQNEYYSEFPSVHQLQIIYGK